MILSPYCGFKHKTIEQSLVDREETPVSRVFLAILAFIRFTGLADSTTLKYGEEGEDDEFNES